MAIKKRTPANPKELNDLIEKFGNAADTIVEPLVPKASTVEKEKNTQPVRITAPARVAEELPATMLIRWPDDSLPALLAEVSEAEERSKHATALRALRRGLESMRADQ